MADKPTVFNYQDYVEALNRINELEAELELWKEIANQQRIRLRILEEDKKDEGEIYRIGRSR